MIVVQVQESNDEITVNYYYEKTKKPILTLIIKPRVVYVSMWCGALTVRDIIKIEKIISESLSDLGVKRGVVGTYLEKPLSEQHIHTVVRMVLQFLEDVFSKPRKLKRLEKC